MANTECKATTELAEETVAVEESAATVDNSADENMNEEKPQKKTASKKTKAKTVKVVEMEDEEELEPLTDDADIEVVSMVPNVYYYDKEDGIMYEWPTANHEEPMPFEVVKRMWRGSKGYFRNMWLRPDDERVIDKLKLRATYNKYYYLMDAANYTKENVDEICKTISSISDSSRDLRIFICNKIRNMVEAEEIVDYSVIKSLENRLNIELTD